MPTTDEAHAAVAALFDRFVTDNGAPGVAFGIVEDGRLVHSGAYGRARLADGAPPTVDTQFRIASMTKSFTASTILMLRDEGRLSLDDPASMHVPELAGWRPWSTDSPEISIRHLLTMTAGLPTDDPWGDRQQGLPIDEFGRFLAGGVSLAGPPGVRFEYSNLGYAILGRIVANVTGREYGAAIRDRVLAPLGMAAGFEPDAIAPDLRAAGYVRRADAWHDEPIDRHGAFAPMGGLWASVSDLARWVGELTDAFPARDDPDDGHALRRASRREMQQAHAAIQPELSWTSVDTPPNLQAAGYGYGLFVLHDLALGRVVGHGGGYPGFGSHMRWHPTSGLGVVALANARYAPVARLTMEALRLLVPAAPGDRKPAPWPETAAARGAVEGLLAGWDDEVAAGLFAMNVALDEPLADRRSSLAKVQATHGALTPDDAEPVTTWGRAHQEWWLRGERGRVRVDMILDPETPPRVQWLEVASVPEPPSELVAIAARIVELLSEPGPTWPDDVALAEQVDRAALERAVRAAEAGFGPVELGRVLESDGETSATLSLVGGRGKLRLELAMKSPHGPLTKVVLRPETLEPPVEMD
jgi:CubicO group peptidase (beta-lactamase class C family)